MIKKQKPRLLVVVNFSTGGGTEKMAASILESLYQKFEVTLLSAEPKGYFFKKINKRNLFISYLIQNKEKGSFYRNAFRIWVRLLITRPCALLVFNYQLGLATGFALKFTPQFWQPKKRVLAHHISIKAVSSETEAKRMRRYFNAYSQHVVPSSALIDELKNVNSNMKVKVIQNGLDINKIKESGIERNPYLKQKRKWHCVYVGGLRADKRVDKLLLYFSLLPEREEVSLTIIGDGNERTKLEKLATSLGIQTQCKFVGHVENPYPYISHADILVQTSDWETFGLTILEAMVLKTVVLATQGFSLGLTDIIQDGINGRLIDHQDQTSFTHAWSDLLQSEEKRKVLIERAYKDSKSFSESCMLEGYRQTLGCL